MVAALVLSVSGALAQRAARGATPGATRGATRALAMAAFDASTVRALSFDVTGTILVHAEPIMAFMAPIEGASMPVK